MRLFIQIRDGQPYEHPIFEDNFIMAFPHIDVNNLPPAFALFERVAVPVDIPEFKVPVVSYQWIDGVVKDVWTFRDMTAEEKMPIKEKQIQAVKATWAKMPQRDNFSTWVFNEETLKYEPPIPRPETGEYIWHGPTLSWVDKPQYPDDGKEYRLDFASIAWVEVT